MVSASRSNGLPTNHEPCPIHQFPKPIPAVLAVLPVLLGIPGPSISGVETCLRQDHRQGEQGGPEGNQPSLRPCSRVLSSAHFLTELERYICLCRRDFGLSIPTRVIHNPGSAWLGKCPAVTGRDRLIACLPPQIASALRRLLIFSYATFDRPSLLRAASQISCLFSCLWADSERSLLAARMAVLPIHIDNHTVVL